MTDNVVITSILSMAGLGFFFASVLAFVNKRLEVKEDPNIERIESALPGVNCGACGFTSCRLYAESLVKGESAPDGCKAGGAEVMNVLSGILGMKLEKKTRQVALIHCGADASKRKKKAIYRGIETCVAAHNMQGAEALCAFGCLGYGDCVKACPFGALVIVNGLPEVDKDKCTACGKCAEACPRDLITVEDMETGDLIYVACSNRDKAPEARKACPVACIACGMCQRLTGGIFYVEDNLARVKYDKIKDVNNGEEVMGKCPTKCILRV